MSKQTIIYLVRHGEAAHNKQLIISGHSEFDLTEEGKEQVRQTKRDLKNVHFDVVYSSDLRRAADTAEILHGKPVSETNKMYELRERDFGSLDGKPQHVYDEGNKIKQGMTDEEGWIFKHVPDMESDHELSERFLPALEKIAKNNPAKTILVVAHGGAIRIALMKLTGYTRKELPAGSFKNAGYAKLTYNEGTGLKVIQINGVKL